MSELFSDLPVFPPALPDDELRLLNRLPQYHPQQSVTELDDTEHAACRRLERRGLVKVHREKMDPIAVRPTWFAGRLDASFVREVGA